MYWLDIQSVNVWWRYNISDMDKYMKNEIKSRSVPYLAVISGILTYQYLLETQSVKVWWRYNNSDMNGRQKCKDIPKKPIKVKVPSITYHHIWYVDTSKCVHSVKVWSRYVVPNANAAHFCYTFFRHTAVLVTCPKKNNLEWYAVIPWFYPIWLSFSADKIEFWQITGNSE